MSRKETTISEALREAILESDMPLAAIERETGIQRASIMRFLRGSQSLRLDKADVLAKYFGLKVVKTKRR